MAAGRTPALTTQPAAEASTATAARKRPLAGVDPQAAVSFVGLATITIYLGFNAGGFFVIPPAIVAIALLLCLLLQLTIAARPVQGAGPLATTAIAGMALYSVWTLVSSAWSHSPSRGLIAFDRAMLYTLTLTLTALWPASRHRVRALLGGLTVAIVVIATVAIITRLLPRVWPLAPDVSADRLSYPLTYWNADGLLFAIGIIGALQFACSARERLSVRVLATAALPLLATTLYFTLSRGSIAVLIIGAGLFVLFARARGTLPTLVAAAPPSAAALLVAYHAVALTGEHPTSAAAVHEGHHVVIALAAAIVAAALLRLILEPVERRLRSPGWRLPVAPWVLVGAAVAVLVAALLLTGVAQHEIHGFGQTNAIANLSNQRERLTSASNNGRFDIWRVAVHEFDRHPLIGGGAGTFQNVWNQHRNSNMHILNAHSLYLETLAELGIVGLGLLVVGLGAILVGLVRAVRAAPTAERAVPVAALAASVMLLVHAGIDWDWEMPAVVVWFFAVGGATLAVKARAEPGPAWRHASPLRLLLGIGCLLLAVTPALLYLSQVRLERAANALAANDCGTTISEGLGSISAVDVRPEPYMLVGLCDARLGYDSLAIRMERSAVDRDPQDWEFHYALAIVQAASGVDPRAAARRAHHLDPREPLTHYALRLYAHGDRRLWRRRGLAAPLPP
jgi:O-antigen ligase